MSVSFNEFKHVSKQAWIEKINSDLKGIKKADEFKYIIEPGVEISSFMTLEDTAQRNPITGPKSRSGIFILAGDDQKMNEHAHEMLAFGVSALGFEVDQNTDFENLFKNILLDIITIVLHVNKDSDEAILNLQKFLIKNYPDKTPEIIINRLSSVSGLINMPVILEYNEEFLNRLVFLTKRLNQIINESNYKNLAVKLYLKKDFLAQISELRAIRILWANLLELKNLPHFPLRILVSVESETKYEGNVHPLIVTNYLCLSSYLGMCDFCFGVPYFEDFETARLQINIQSIFLEESLIDQVTDTCAGSYIVENLTENFVTKAWTKSFE